MTLMATIESSMAITAPSRMRPAQRSSEKKYGRASRQMIASVERRRDTSVLLSAGDGWKIAAVDGADRVGRVLAPTSVPIPKFASLCSTLVCELRNRGTLG